MICVQLVGGQFEMESNFVINDPETILHMLTLMDSCSMTLQASHLSYQCHVADNFLIFLREKQLLLSARLSQHSSVCLSVCHMGGSVKNGASYDYEIFTFGCLKTLVSGTVKLFHKFKGGHPERGLYYGFWLLRVYESLIRCIAN